MNIIILSFIVLGVFINNILAFNTKKLSKTLNTYKYSFKHNLSNQNNFINNESKSKFQLKVYIICYAIYLNILIHNNIMIIYYYSIHSRWEY